MFQMKRETLARLTFSVILIAISGCTIFPVETPVNTLVLQPSIESPTVITSRTSIPSLTPSPSATITLTIPPPTLTSLPTLNPEQALAKIRELFETNGGCKLPCWWGITPGVSQSNNVFNFIQSIGQDYEYNSSIDKISESVYFYFFDLPEEMRYSPNDYFEGRIYADNGIITRISVQGFNWSSYHLPTFLMENGKPDDVWVSTAQDKLGNKVPFSVYLLYAEKGMLVSYGARGRVNGEEIEGCIDVSPILFIWIPEKKLSFSDAEALLGTDISQGQYKSILESTGGKMDADQFYQQFKDLKTVPCFETSVDLWTPIQ